MYLAIAKCARVGAAIIYWAGFYVYGVVCIVVLSFLIAAFLFRRAGQAIDKSVRRLICRIFGHHWMPDALFHDRCLRCGFEDY